MADSSARSKQTPVAVAPALRPGREAAAEALAQLDHGEAPQVGLLGDTGTGKTTAARELVKLYLEKSPGSVFIVDDKDATTRFQGEYRADVADLRANPIDWTKGRTIVFRGRLLKGERVDLEEIAELAWVRAQRSRKTLLVFDELTAGRRNLTVNQQWRKGVTWVPQGFTAGRTAGVANLWGGQLPQLIPLEPFEESSAIITFRLAGAGLAKLRDRDYLLGGAEEAIRRLHGPPDPPNTRGDFVLLYRGRPWNGNVYKFEVTP
jgi:ABC-type cobalamin/Fe3+-siderophores transport system ATPase subunit